MNWDIEGNMDNHSARTLSTTEVLEVAKPRTKDGFISYMKQSETTPKTGPRESSTIIKTEKEFHLLPDVVTRSDSENELYFDVPDAVISNDSEEELYFDVRDVACSDSEEELYFDVPDVVTSSDPEEELYFDVPDLATSTDPDVRSFVDDDSDDLVTPIGPKEIEKLNQEVLERLHKLVTAGNPLDKYQRLEEIDEGGTSTVYRGIRMSDEKVVVIKVMALYFHWNGTAVIHNRDTEIECIKHISSLEDATNGNITRYLDSYLLNDELWLVIEYVEGINLWKVLPYVPNEEEIAVIFYNVLKALQCIHNNKIVHHDMKTDNILLGLNGDVKITDFGLSDIVVPVMTQEGTCWYMAPEQIATDSYDTKVDIWGLGIVLIEVLTMTVPYGDEEDEERVKELIVENGKPSIETDEPLPPDLADFLDQCLTVNPEDRPSATELLGHKLFQKYDVNSTETVASLVDFVRDV